VGKRWYKQAYGVDVRIGWNPDSFGYTWQLPQIYKKSGIDYFVTQKMAWNDTNQMPFKFFWWESPDGSKVLSYFPHDYANDNLNLVRLSRDYVIAQKQATGLPIWCRRPRRRTDARDSGRGIPLGCGRTRDAEGRVWHGAELLHGARKTDCAGEPGVGLQVDCEGIYSTAGG
jgi:hypothetical protein